MLMMGLSFVFVSCTTPAPPGTAVREWSCKIRELQIQPIFPPREDFAVGDIYIVSQGKEQYKSAAEYCKSKTQGDFVPTAVHLGQLPDVDKAIDDYYQLRLDLPSSPSSFGADVKAPAYRIPQSSSPSLFTSSDRRRLRAVAFPDFMSIKVTGFDVGAIAPILGVLSPIGFGSESVESISISVPAAESYGVPTAILSDTMNNSVTWLSPNKNNNSCVKELAVQVGKSKKVAVAVAELARLGAPDSSGAFEIAMISEVFYARSIDTSLSFKSSVAAGLNRNRGSQPSSDDMPSIPNLTFATSGAAVSNPAPGEVNARAAMNAVAASIMDQLASRGGLPGVSLSARVSSGHGIGLTRTFDRPVAIGYRAIYTQFEPLASDPGCYIVRSRSGSVDPASTVKPLGGSGATPK
jgi:hypothetical protein